MSIPGPILQNNETGSHTTHDSFVRLLSGRAEEHPNQNAYTFLAKDGTSTDLSYVELHLRARAIGSWLQHAGATGRRVLLVFPPGLQYISAFFGCLYAGAVAVPAYPPRHNRLIGRLRSIITDSQPSIALTTRAVMEFLQDFRNDSASLKEINWQNVEEIPDNWHTNFRELSVGRDTLAFLQYTSGSTAAPKGVMISHGNLLHNQRLIQHAFGQNENSIIVGWLPLFHDMGLIGNVLQPLYCGARCILLSPMTFLQRPVSWLEAISKYRATTSGGPNFAYELCVRKIGPEQRRLLDLSSWTVAFNGAEPIFHETLDRFTDAFAPSGFRRQAFFPCYGLAEATLFVAGGRKMQGPMARSFSRAALQNSRAVSAVSEDTQSATLVSCGRVTEQTLKIVDPVSLIACVEGEVGEIWVAGPSIAGGYWSRSEVSSQTFDARLGGTGNGRYLRTGDLGFVYEGDLYIAGRLKDLIIIRGRNHYPQDIEHTVEEFGSDVRAGEGAAFSVEAGGEERLVVVYEVSKGRTNELDAAIETIRKAISDQHELQTYSICLVRSGTILKTSSGKIQRQAVKQAFERGELKILKRWQLERPAEDEEQQPVDSQVATSALEIQNWLIAKVAARAGTTPAEIDPDAPTAAYGLDSLSDVELVHAVERQFQVSLPVLTFLRDASIADVAREVLKQVSATPQTDFVTVSDSPAEQEFPLSLGQSALWFLHQLAPESPAYNVVAGARVNSPLDWECLHKAFQSLVDRHPLLRTTFESRAGRPLQIIHDRAEADFQIEKIATSGPGDLQAYIQTEVVRPFHLEQGPLFRIRGLKCDSGEKVLLIAAHHIIVDLWSLTVLVRDMAALYDSEVSGRSPELPVQTSSYHDYILRQERLLRGEHGHTLWNYWRDQLSGELPVLDIPTDYPRSAVPTNAGRAEFLAIAPGLRERLQALALQHGTTLFTVLLAAYQTLLYAWSGQQDAIVGCPTMGRMTCSFDAVVGYFVNPVPLRTTISPHQPFSSFLEHAKQVAAGAFQHQEFPFGLLVDRLQPQRELNRSPLFQTMFVFEQTPSFLDPGLPAFALGLPGQKLKVGALELESCELGPQVAQFDLTLIAVPLADGLSLCLQFDTNLFKSETARKVLRRYEGLLTRICEDQEQAICDIAALPPAERQSLLEQFSGPARSYSAGLCLHELFRKQAEKTPDATALLHQDMHVSFRTLELRSNAIAAELRKKAVQPEVRVGVLLPRNVDLVAAVLGVLKAGGAYVPLDPAYPKERLLFMLQDASASVLLTEANLSGLLPEFSRTVMFLDDVPVAADSEVPSLFPEAPANEENLAYVIYTSGSTGRPKGVAIEHRSAVGFLDWANESFSADELRGVLFSTSLCFDLSIFELFLPLTCGGTVIIAEDALELVQAGPWREAISLINMVPSALRELIRHDAVPEQVITINLAGEPLPRELVERAYEQAQVKRVFNFYGPSEDTTYSTFSLVQRGEAGPPTIGRPIANTQVYITWHDQLLPLESTGELCIGGAGLARGYLGRPDLTAERFVPNPHHPMAGARCYKTGDLARYKEDGSLEFLGRSDHQVKIRGFRIELGEIEAALAEHPDVREAVVLANEGSDGDKRLVAYLVRRGTKTLAARELRDDLKKKLPLYMIPQEFVYIDSMPLTRNGKIDRRAMAALQPDNTPESDFLPPAAPVEEIVAGIWAEVLNVARVGRRDNFFELGGHSLHTTQVVSRLNQIFHCELPVRTIFEASTVEALAAVVEEAGRQGAAPTVQEVSDVPAHGSVPLSPAQHRLWLIHQLQPESTAYNVAYSAQIDGALNIAVLEQSINEIVRRHAALRTSITGAGPVPCQAIAPALTVQSSLRDLRRIKQTLARELEKQALREDADRPFQLEQGPLLRASLIALSATESVLMVSMHHIICDGWSLGIFGRELSALYDAFLAGMPSPLSDLTTQYASFACWQQQQLEEEAFNSQLLYWRDKLRGAPLRMALPYDRPQASSLQMPGASYFCLLPGPLVQSLEALGRRHGATLFMTLLTGLQLLLSRITGQTDIVVGTPIANRNRAESEALIGCFVNTLVMRSDISGDPGFLDLLERVRDNALEAYNHQDLPYEKVLKELNPGGGPGQEPFLQVVFALQNLSLPVVQMNGVQLRPQETENRAAKFDLTVQLIASEQGLASRWEYRADVFEAATIERFARFYQSLLESAVHDPAKTVSELALIRPEEQRQILEEWNDTLAPYPAEACIQQLYVERAKRTPDKVAVVCADQHLTYAELNSRSDRLATYLQAHGVCTDDRVAVVKQRSIETIITLLGILKAGAAYVAIEPSTPDERIAFLLDDLEAQFVVVDQSSLNLTIRTGITKIYVDAAWEVLAQQSSCVKENSGSSGQLAYISYTSGSTGIPKGVAVPHSAVVRLVHNPNYASLGPDEVSIQCAPLAFDASTFEIWGCLLNGGRLAVMPPEQISVDALLDAFRCYEVSTAFITTGLFNLLVEHGADDLAKVKQILTGGEAISAVHVKTLLAASAGHSHLSNVYGPTENTTFTTHHPIRTAGSPACPIPIGRPITNTQVYVLDRHMQPVPIGVEGELFAGGPGLARGYWNRPELTAVSFVPNAFSVHPGERLYRTGDLVKWSRDGNLEYLERRDNQVKVRGFRIELGEIENYLGQHRRVAACAVMARSDELGPKRLVAYVVPRDNESLTANELHGYLADHLPAYMVPVAYVFLKELPLTSSGKVDRKMLPRPDYSASVDDYVPPSTAVEIALTGIWSKVLKVEKVGAGDDFFRLGGDSIMAIQVSAAAIRAGLPLSPQQLFETPKLSDAALKVAATLQGEPSQTGQKTVSKEGSGRDQRKNASAFPQAGVSPRELRILFECLKEKYDRDKVEDIYPLSSLQQGMLFHVLQSSHTDLYVNQQAYTLEGPLNVAALKQAFERVVARHPILRTAFVLTAQGKPVQVVLQSVAVPWQVHDWRELTLSVQQERLGDLHRSDREQEFDLEKPPLIRINLVRLREEVYEFIWSLHLMLLDGWSLPLLLDEVLRLYDAITDQREINLPKPLAYAEYIDWLQVQDPGEAERFWRNALHGFDRATALGRDQVVSAPSACEQLYEEKILTLEASETELLRLFAARNQITVNTLAQAAWALILSRRSGTDDVVFGAVVSGRSVDLPCVDVMIGLLLNTIPVRVHLHSHAPLVPWLKELQSQQVEARRYESSSLVDIQGWSEIPRGQALFESVVIFQNTPVDIAWSEVKGKLRMTGMKSVEKNSFPLTFIIIPGPEMLLKIVYDTGQFHSAAATRLLRQAKDFLNAMATAHSKSVLGSLTEEADTDRDQLISSFNRNLEL